MGDFVVGLRLKNGLGEGVESDKARTLEGPSQEILIFEGSDFDRLFATDGQRYFYACANHR